MIYQNLKEIPKKLENLLLNRTSVHALQSGNILSKEMQEKLKTITTKELYEQLEKLDVIYDTAGWENIKKAPAKVENARA